MSESVVYGVLTTPASLVALGVLAGIVIHLTIFIHGEWHVQAPSIFIGHAILYILVPVAAAHVRSALLSQVLTSAVWASYGYLPGLLSSIVIYRVFFHRLTRMGIPGPWYARVSKLWHMWACRTSQNHLVLARLHAQYGDFVRTGPNEISVAHGDVFMAIDGPRSECLKSEWYDLLHPSLALVTTRNKDVHAARRREWNAGFTTKALVEHERKLMTYIEQLDECFEADARGGHISDVRNLLLWFGFDFMGDLVFSKPFNMLRDKSWHHIIVRLQRALSLLGPFSPVPWLVQVGFKLGPRVSVLKDWFDTVDWCQAQMTARVENPKEGLAPDLAYYLMEADGDRQKQMWMAGDSLLAIVAGSEPTAVALIATFYELTLNPEHWDKIYDELREVDPSDLKTITSLTHLNAVIKEALRMHPALLTGGNRKTTAAGITIGDTYIPPNTTILAPRYVVQRKADCYVRPNDFVPERWSTKPELLLNGAAYAPFGTGHHSCLGRTLANDTMRLVLARCVKKYTIAPAPGPGSVRAMVDVRDQFTTNPGDLFLQFSLRPGV